MLDKIMLKNIMKNGWLMLVHEVLERKLMVFLDNMPLWILLVNLRTIDNIRKFEKLRWGNINEYEGGIAEPVSIEKKQLSFSYV